jgi:hypothetical protein
MRWRLRQKDALPASTDEEERMASMRLETVWNRAILNAFFARWALREAITEPKRDADSRTREETVQFWRSRVLAIDAALEGLMDIRRRVRATLDHD